MNFLNSFIKSIQQIFSPPKPAAKAITLPKNTSAPKQTFQSTQPSTTGTASKPATMPLTKPVSAPPPAPVTQNKGQSQPTPQQTSGGGQPSAPVSRPSTPPPASVTQASLVPKGIGGTAPLTAAGTTMPTSGGLPAASALPGQNAGAPGGLKGVLPDPIAIAPPPLAQFNNTGQNTQQVPTQKAPIGPFLPQSADSGGNATDPIAALWDKIQGSLGYNEAQRVHPITHFKETMQRGASAASGKLTTDPNTGKKTITPSFQTFAGTKPAGPQQPMVTATERPVEQHVADINNYLSKPTPQNLSTTVANVSTPAGIQAIDQAIMGAQISGQHQDVQKLQVLKTQAQQNLQTTQMLDNVIAALSKGFGTANAPGVTEARQPMAFQGIQNAVNNPQDPTPQTPGGLPGQQIPFMPPNLLTAPVQQNKPIFPWAR